MDLWFSGGENSEWRSFLAEMGVRHVTMSYVGLTKRLKLVRPWVIAEHFQDDQHILLDAGGYSYNKPDSGVTEEQAMDMAQHYMAFVTANLDRVGLVTEFDVKILGQDWLQAMREDFYDGLGDKFIPVWHHEAGTDELERLASSYAHVGVLAAGVDDHAIPILNSLVNRYGVKLHGLGITTKKVALATAVRWDSIGSTSWISPSMEGDTIIWTGHELKRYPMRLKDQARKRHKSYMEQQGFDAQKILDDDRKEVLRLSVWSWQQFMKSLDHSRVLSPFGGGITPQAGTADTGSAEQGSPGVAPRPADPENGGFLPAVPDRREHALLPVVGMDFLGDDEEHRESVVTTPAASLLQCNTCLVPETRVLYPDMQWRPIGQVQVGDVLLGFDEQGVRHFKPTMVESITRSRQPVFEIQTEHTQVTATAEHRWLLDGVDRWVDTGSLVPGQSGLRYIGADTPADSDDEYKRGYIGGMTTGDGTLWRQRGFDRWRVALSDREALVAIQQFGHDIGIQSALAIHTFNGGLGGPVIKPGTRKRMWEVSTSARAAMEIIKAAMVDSGSEEYARGWLAGFFDAEGSFDGNSIRVAQKDVAVLEKVVKLGQRIGQVWKIEPTSPGRGVTSARVQGGLLANLEFFMYCQPRITRKMRNLYGKAFRPHVHDEVVSVIPRGAREVVDIQTTLHTFFAEGIATHNCEIREYCPKMKPGAECAYEIPVQVTSKNQMRRLQDAIIEAQYQRTARMMFFEQVKGGYADANTSAEIDRLQKLINAKRDAEKSGFSLHVESHDDMGTGVISRVFGRDVGDSVTAIDRPVDAREIMDAVIVDNTENEGE